MVRAAAQTSKGFYQTIGSLKSLMYLGKQGEGKERSVFYRADYKAMTLFYTVSFDAEGKIASLGGEAETMP